MLPNFSSDLYVRTYIDEIHRQADYLIASVKRLEKWLDDTSDQKDERDFWFFVDSGLGAMAKIGDILWPSQDRKGSAARAKALRDRFGLPDDSPLQARAARNALEHFAERIDRWIESSHGHNMGVSIIGGPGMINLPPADLARYADVTTGEISIFGDTTNIMDGYWAVVELLPKLGVPGHGEPEPSTQL